MASATLEPNFPSPSVNQMSAHIVVKMVLDPTVLANETLGECHESAMTACPGRVVANESIVDSITVLNSLGWSSRTAYGRTCKYMSQYHRQPQSNQSLQ